MWMQPNVHRLRRLQTSGFHEGQQILFCPECHWQADQPVGMKNACPECGASLHLTRIDVDLLALVEGETS